MPEAVAHDSNTCRAMLTQLQDRQSDGPNEKHLAGHHAYAVALRLCSEADVVLRQPAAL